MVNVFQQSEDLGWFTGTGPSCETHDTLEAKSDKVNCEPDIFNTNKRETKIPFVT